MVTPTEAIEAVKKCGSVSAAARALGINRTTFRRVLASGTSGVPVPSVSRPARRCLSFSREQFAANFDNDTRIRGALKQGVATLTDDAIIEDSEFRAERCKHAPSNGWRRISIESEFSKNRFSTKGRVFWSSPATKKWAVQNVEGTIE